MFGMVDFSMLSNNMISGLNEDEISEISDIQEIIHECSSSIFEDFEKLPPEINEDLQELENHAIPPSTAAHERKWIMDFEQFLCKNNLNSNFNIMTKVELADRLRYYYSQLRTKKLDFYSKSSLICIRAALYRFFKGKYSFDIINEKEFFHANNILKAMTKKWLENGGKIKPFDSIEDEDMTRLRSYFDRRTPETLQEEVYFILIYYLGLRGREWIRRLRKSDLHFCSDSNGREYLEVKGIESLQKNQQPSLSNDPVSPKSPRIYKSENPDTCPVSAVKLLLEKLPEDSETLFYKKTTKWEESVHWYNLKMPMGVNTIGSLMNKISKNAQLSRVYTGHCIRPTIVTNLFNKGVPMEEISCITGHKNIKSVKRYVRKVNDDKKAHYASLLAKGFEKDSNPTLDNPYIFQASGEKKMIIEADGGNNVVRISFT